MRSLAPAQCLAYLHAEVDRFNALLPDADFAAPVAACPGWTVEDLVRHQGNVHRWAEQIARTGELKRNGDEGPSETADLAAWFREGAALLTSTLETVNPEDSGWSLSKADQTRRFWFRRQAQETFVHRIDLETALQAPSPRDAVLAADGVGEVFDVFLQRMLDRGDATEIVAPVALQATDVDAAWTIQTDRSITDGASGDALIEGPAEALLLLLWKRIDSHDSRLVLSGSAPALDSVTGGRLTP